MNMQPIPTDSTSKHTFWQRQVLQYQRSSIANAAQFCRDEGLPYQSFMTWLKKLKSEQPRQEQKPKSFIRIPAQNTKPNSISCRLPNGLELSWDSATSATQIAAVIQEVSQL